MNDLSQATTPERVDELKFRSTIYDGWQQGRGAYGGLVLGILTRAMEVVNATPEWPLRILNAEILAPVMPGLAEVEIEVLRRSSAVASFSARMLQQGHLLARSTGIFGKQRIADRERTPVDIPLLAPWEAADAWPSDNPMAPAFAQHFEFRPTGVMPFSGADRPQATGWICPRLASRGVGTPEVVAMADAWWPADLATETAPRPMSTLAFTLELFAPVLGAPVRPHFHRATVPASHGGFSFELRELWDEHGRLVALNQQTFVFIR